LDRPRDGPVFYIRKSHFIRILMWQKKILKEDIMAEDSKKCDYCGSEIKGGVDFCAACGRDLLKKDSGTKASTKGFRYDYLLIPGFIIIFAVAFIITRDNRTAAEPHSHESMNQSSGMGSFEEMLANLPDDYSQLVTLGNKLMDGRHYAVAAECYRRALAIDSSNPDIVSDLGSCLHATGDFEGAASMFKRVIDMDSLHGIAYLNLGIVYRTMQENDSAKFYWKKLISMFPDEPISDSARKYMGQITP
jgi:tetratricopeptide (TPR) repeat protein